MGFFSKLFPKANTRILTTNKIDKIHVESKNVNKKELSENPFKNIKNNFLQFFRTSRVVDAYQNTNNTKIDKLITKGKSYYKSVKFPENNNFSLLHQAISDKNIDIIDLILNKKYSSDDDIIHDQDNDLGLAPIHLTCIYNYPDIIEILIKKGNSKIDVLTSTDNLTSLHIAASAGSLKSLAYISDNYYLNNKKKIKENKTSEIDESLNDNENDYFNKNEEKDKKEKNSNLNVRTRNAFVSKHKSKNISIESEKEKNSEFDNKKIDEKCPLDIFNAEKWTPLHYACFQNRIDCVSYLLDNGSDLLLQNNQKLSPLAICVLEDNIDLFLALYNFHFKSPQNNLGSDQEYNIEVSEQAKLVHIASISKKGTKCLDYLLGDPNNVNMICSIELNATPLHFACMKDNIKAVKSLLRYNANVNVADYLGNTPLFYATENGNLEILKMLHEYGADGIKKNNNGVNCFQIAMNQDNRDVRLFYLGQNQYRHLSEKDRIF